MTTDQTSQPLDVDRAAFTAVAESLRSNGHHFNDDHLREAFDKACEVYDQAETAEIERIMRECLFGGMEVDDGVRIRIKYAHDLAAGMVSAFDALVQQRGCENYVEWESTVTDPATERAVEAGTEEIPLLRRYRFIVVKPGGKTPHELRREAEVEVERLREVADAAIVWRRSGDTADGHRRAEAALIAAVDKLTEESAR